MYQNVDQENIHWFLIRKAVKLWHEQLRFSPPIFGREMFVVLNNSLVSCNQSQYTYVIHMYDKLACNIKGGNVWNLKTRRKGPLSCQQKFCFQYLLDNFCLKMMCGDWPAVSPRCIGEISRLLFEFETDNNTIFAQVNVQYRLRGSEESDWED